jgi:hypothetical protein
LRLLQINFRLQAGYNDATMFSTNRALLIRPGQRSPNLRIIWKTKIRGHDSGDQIALPIKIDAAANDIRILAVMRLPKLVTQNHNVRFSRMIFLRQEHAAEQRLNP